MKRLLFFLLLSLGAHLLLALSWLGLSDRGPLPGGVDRASVEIVGLSHVGSQAEGARITGGTEPVTGPSVPGTGSGESGNDERLADIRRRIEGSKRYPLIARRSSIEGVTVVRFAIGPEGEVQAVSVTQGSGSAVLDNEAIATIRRAAPFPTWSEPLDVALRFSLPKP